MGCKLMTIQIVHSCEFDNAIGKKCSVTIKKLPKESQKIFRIGNSQTFVLFEGYYYASITTHSEAVGHKIHLPSRISRQYVIEFTNKIIQEMKKYSSVSYRELFLWNGKLFVKYCKKSELKITQTGNTLFSDWWSLDIRTYNPNIQNKKFTRKNFEKELKSAQKWVDSHKKKINFFYPKVKWFVEDAN